MKAKLLMLFMACTFFHGLTMAQAPVVKFSVPKPQDKSQWEKAPAGSTWPCYNKTVKVRVELTRTGGDGLAGKKLLINTRILHPATQVELKSKNDEFTVSSKNDGKFAEYFIVEYSFADTPNLPSNPLSCMLNATVTCNDTVLITVTKKYKYE